MTTMATLLVKISLLPTTTRTTMTRTFPWKMMTFHPFRVPINWKEWLQLKKRFGNVDNGMTDSRHPCPFHQSDYITTWATAMSKSVNHLHRVSVPRRRRIHDCRLVVVRNQRLNHVHNQQQDMAMRHTF